MAEVELREFWLGLTPYTVIEVRAASDGSDSPSIYVTEGGGAEEQRLGLATLALTESPPERSPLAEMLREVAADEEHASPAARAVLERITRECNPEWRAFVLGEQAY
jgi:hypothetical protein